MEKYKGGGGSSAMYKGLRKYKFPTYTHSVLYYNGTYYDPEFGVMERYTPEGTMTHYLELYIEEAYEGLDVDVAIPPDFMEAFASDQGAYEIFKQLSYPQKARCIHSISHYKNPTVRKTNIAKRLEELKRAQ